MDAHHIAGAALTTTLTVLLLGACSDEATPRTEEQPSPPAESSSSAGSSTTGYNTLGPISRANLAPGRWAVTAAGTRDVPVAVVDLPAGLNGGAEYIWAPPEDGGWILGYWTVDEVYLDPCTRNETFGPMSSADQFVEALAAQRRTTTSDAVPVTLGGYDGEYVELSAPTGIDYSTCRGDVLTVFETTAKGGRHWIDGPGVIERYWVLDVGGEPVVLTGAVSPGTTDSQLEQLTDIVESVEFRRS